MRFNDYHVACHPYQVPITLPLSRGHRLGPWPLRRKVRPSLGRCRRSGISNLHFHDLRREFACRLLESSADLYDVKEFLGHANVITTSRYLLSTEPPRVLERAH